ncbi:MAG: Fur family transcriptional regulator [Desulfuromonadales bacterium]|nr:Fur family transcriptional regulator [Desulfuromonadales bacterium]
MEHAEKTFFSCNKGGHQICIAEAIHVAEVLCRQRKQRFTNIRRRVLQLVWHQHKPIGAYQVLEALQQEGRAAPPTVYRALDFLQQMGLVHRIASLNAYVGCAHPGIPHDGQFLICESCKTLAELDAAEISNAIQQSADRSGFKAHRQTVEIMGLCPRCR